MIIKSDNMIICYTSLLYGIVNNCGRDRMTALLWACQRCHQNVVELLLVKNANIESRGKKSIALLIQMISLTFMDVYQFCI